MNHTASEPHDNPVAAAPSPGGEPNGLGISPADLGRIADAVAEKVIKPIVHTVDQEVDQVGDKVVSGIDALGIPDVTELNDLLGDPADFVHAVAQAVEPGSLVDMAGLPHSLEAAGIKTLDKGELQALVAALQDVLDVTENLVEGLGMVIDTPAAFAAKALEGVNPLFDAIPTGVWGQLKYPGDLLDLVKLTEQIQGQARLLRRYAPHTEVSAGMTAAAPGERRFAISAAASFFSVAADLLDYLGDAFPLGVAAGGNGGVAAGANLTGAVRVHIVKVGTFVFGLIKFVLGVIAEVLNLVNQGMDDLA